MPEYGGYDFQLTIHWSITFLNEYVLYTIFYLTIEAYSQLIMLYRCTYIVNSVTKLEAMNTKDCFKRIKKYKAPFNYLYAYKIKLYFYI